MSHGNNQQPPSATSGPEAWTQRDLELLHEMVRDFDRARWLRGQLKWWAVWLLGVPTAGVTLWKAIEELLKAFKGWGH